MENDFPRLGIYGGTFSPVHLGHVRAADAFVRFMKLSRLLVMPCSLPPHKAEIEGASPSERLNMLHLAFRDNRYYQDSTIEISDFEISRQGISYTINTLRYFRENWHSGSIWLLVGTDMFLTLDHWKCTEEIFDIANIVFMRRESEADKSRQINDKRWSYVERFGARIHELDEPPMVISSTEVRERLRLGLSTDGFLSPRVAEYIADNKLYKKEMRNKDL